MDRCSNRGGDLPGRFLGHVWCPVSAWLLHPGQGSCVPAGLLRGCSAIANFRGGSSEVASLNEESSVTAREKTKLSQHVETEMSLTLP